MDVLRRASKKYMDAVIQWLGIVIISIGVERISLAAGLIVLGSLTLAYGIIREIVANTAAEPEEPTDDGIR